MNKRALMLTAAATALLSGHAYGASPCSTTTSTTGNCDITTAITTPLYTGAVPTGVTGATSTNGSMTIDTNGSLTLGTNPPTAPAITINSGTSVATPVDRQQCDDDLLSGNLLRHGRAARRGGRSYCGDGRGQHGCRRELGRRILQRDGRDEFAGRGREQDRDPDRGRRLSRHVGHDECGDGHLRQPGPRLFHRRNGLRADRRHGPRCHLPGVGIGRRSAGHQFFRHQSHRAHLQSGGNDERLHAVWRRIAGRRHRRRRQPSARRRPRLDRRPPPRTSRSTSRATTRASRRRPIRRSPAPPMRHAPARWSATSTSCKAAWCRRKAPAPRASSFWVRSTAPSTIRVKWRRSERRRRRPRSTRAIPKAGRRSSSPTMSRAVSSTAARRRAAGRARRRAPRCRWPAIPRRSISRRHST